MSRRSAGGWWRRLITGIEGLDPERVATAVVGAGALLAVGAVLLGGFVPSVRPLSWLLYPIAALFPLLGVAIAAAACWWAWTLEEGGETAMLEGPPPETAVTRTTYPVGQDAERTLTEATQGWYRCRPTEPIADVRGRLADGAVRVLTAKRGLTAEAAREAVRSGSWTDDPVAAAFLSDDRRQPGDERLRAAVDPGAAYHRRVRRTLAAIDGVADGTGRGDEEVDR
ncbi:DUF7269 family protein [Natrinema longum]|uniref:Uncharacterized protein n=1 Tax=Natrinema longum TaxID=370324 RepID=A0A8A2U8I0_9EURY|nr:hypothetical protein [Natrinema longum]MBZ6493649.1 hypothetical protein [Natrinema longum]QSW85010.1 hypothetical protein J0X27_16420 [Natrinema longum]